MKIVTLVPYILYYIVYSNLFFKTNHFERHKLLYKLILNIYEVQGHILNMLYINLNYLIY